MGRPRKNFLNQGMTKPKRKYTKKETAEAPKTKEALANELEDLQKVLETSLENQMKTLEMYMEAEGNFISLASETEMSLKRMQYHCEQVQKSTGSLTLEDVNYCINLTTRIIEHKFKKA